MLVRNSSFAWLTSIDGFIADADGDLRFGAHWSEQVQGDVTASTLSRIGIAVDLLWGRKL
jgi:hypothetical protein